ncbi:MAG: hypothetical protein O9332_06915 [Microcystis sp. LE19-10.1B]|uniref:hypothetical protein n=1 Tax=Microcystis sp. LE19-10.1B TaxID=3016428 RepID=UPI0022CBA757|nr:hypothetical protein [Microcystis sp. LE19-10.1B]MCZ8025175.1 hypothetical protein [Microcystis sp. LE19-10.1B]
MLNSGVSILRVSIQESGVRSQESGDRRQETAFFSSHPTPYTPHPTPHTLHPAPFPDQWQKSSLKPQNQSILPPWWHSIAPVSAVSGRYRDINGN